MADIREQLRKKYAPENRYANFGPALKSLRIQGFRGINDLHIDFQFPILAISGLNGAGKSTVGQLCLGAYKKPQTVRGIKRFYVRDFFPASAVDPNPFNPNSSVIFEYNTTDVDNPQTLTVTRAAKEWSGYKRQPERSCYYIGFTIYIPKVEQRDLSMYRAAEIQLAGRRTIPEDVKSQVGRILGQPYEALHFQGITHGPRKGELGVATRFNAQYSENNMGFGEGRTLYLVDLLESSPEQSLFVIEEPETSLHENAQFELGKYLLDVCNRRHHQIVLTTHSSTLLNALPADSRLLLLRDNSGVAAFPQMSAARVRSILSGGHHRELCVIVEDEFAKLLLIEMVRSIDPMFLKCMEVHSVGDTKAVLNAARLMQRLNRTYAAVRDPDIGADETMGLFSFPGTNAPEREVFENTHVRREIYHEFGIDVAAVLALKNVTDHHNFVKSLANEADALRDYFATFAVKSYIGSVDRFEYEPLVRSIMGRIR